jgi:DNA replicative helicase MCM subunit Mcm2 (Cdc46/Mcm family)
VLSLYAWACTVAGARACRGAKFQKVMATRVHVDGCNHGYHQTPPRPTPPPPHLHPPPPQIIKVQEDPSNIPEGETPRSLLMYAFDTNVDACKPGDKVTVTGEGGVH